RDALEAAMIGGGDEPGEIVAALLGGGEQAPPPFPGPFQPDPFQPDPAAWAPEPPRWEPVQGADDPFGETSADEPLPLVPPPGAPHDRFFASDAPPTRPPPPAYPSPPAYAPSPAPGGAAGPADRLLDVLVETVSKL